MDDIPKGLLQFNEIGRQVAPVVNLKHLKTTDGVLQKVTATWQNIFSIDFSKKGTVLASLNTFKFLFQYT